MNCKKCNIEIKPKIFQCIKVKACGLIPSDRITNVISGQCPTSDWQDGYLQCLEDLQKPTDDKESGD